jgi:hypothetical protein
VATVVLTSKSLWQFYDSVSEYEYTDADRARKMFDDLLAAGIDTYTAPPELWHNASMVAARVKHREAEEQVVLRGLNEYPGNVILLCDEMQMRQTTHYDPARAKEIWQQLDGMDRSLTAPHWRFWVYGAIYHATQLCDQTTALGLLDEGLRSVRRDALMDILRSYRRVLIDCVPSEPLDSEEAVIDHQRRALDQLEQRYRWGIELGVETAYVLATDLAVLCQERAGTDLKVPETEPVSSADAEGAGNHNDYLDRALEYLSLAERLYTGNENHPLWDLYEPRIRILMAQRKYGDALKLLNSLPRARLTETSGLATMRRLAARMTGETLDDAGAPDLGRALGVLLQNEGEQLYAIAQANPAVQSILVHVAQRLVQ